MPAGTYLGGSYLGGEFLTEAPAVPAPTVTKPANQSTIKNVAATLNVVGTNMFSVTAEGLPTGLSIVKASEAHWEISGTASGAVGVSTVSLRVKNSAGAEVSTTFTWTVSEAAATVNKPAAQISTRGNAIGSLAITGAHMITMVATALPAGLTLGKVSEAEWRVTGIPTATKTVTAVTIEVKNGEGAGESKSFNWTVEETSFTEGSGTYKFRLKLSISYPMTFQAVKNSHGDMMEATASPSQGYGTNDPQEAWLLRNLFSAFVE